MNNQFLPQSQVPVPNQLVCITGVQPAPAKPLPQHGNSERKVENFVHYFSNPSINNGRYFLRKNQPGAKLVIKGTEIIPWSETRLIDILKADAFFYGHEQLTDKQIKLAFQIISGKEEIWTFDTEEERTMPFRTITNSVGGFAYRLNRNSWFITNNFNRVTKGYIPNGMIDIPFPPIPDALYGPLDSDYQNSPGFTALKELICNRSNMPDERLLIVLTWLIQAMSSNNYTLLELFGESKVGKSFAQSILRELVDPHIELVTKLPKKLADFEQLAMDGHVMSFDAVNNLDDDKQIVMTDVLSVNGIKIAHSTTKNECKSESFIHHPIILNSVMPVVTNEKLLSNTLTIEMKPPIDRSRAFRTDKNLIYNSRLEILKLAKSISEFNAYPDLPKCTYQDLSHFAEIGLKLSKIIYRTTTEFEKQFSSLIQEQTQAKLEENQTSLLIYLWAKENPSTENVLSASDWIKLLEPYHDATLGDWKINPKQLGVDLKNAATVLREFGIKCESLGKRGSFVKWKLTTPEMIGLEANYFVPAFV